MAEQKQNATGSLPKNIRQIGTSIGNTRVYLEDYVYTCLHTPQQQEAWEHRGFVLLGRLEQGKDYLRYFISGLIRIRDNFFHDGILEFCDETWTYIYQEMKQYFDNLEIVGWGQDVGGASASLTAEIERCHKQNFNIHKNVLFLMDEAECEESFYIFEKNMLQRREGYYVYYEKNPQMQEYMIATKKSRELDIAPDDIREPVVHSYREALLDKKAQLANRKWNGVLYTTSMLLVLSVCVLGVSTVNNVEKMQNLETTVSRISSQAGQAGGTGGITAPAMSTNMQQADDGTGAPDSVANPDTAAGTDQENDKMNDGDAKDAADGNGGNTQKPADNGTGEDVKDTDSDKDAGETEDSNETATTLTDAQTWLLQGYYVVRKGDNLAGISRKIYGTPKKAAKICELNGIDDMDKIYAGQKLKLP